MSQEEDMNKLIENLQPTNNGKHLSVVGLDLKSIPKAIHAKFGGNLESLDFSFNQLKKVENLEKFVNLKSLVLDNNEIESIKDLPHFQRLETLWLNNNNLTDLDEVLDVLQNLPSLNYLSLLKNPACPNEFTGNDNDDYQRYRYYVLYKLKNLKFLDSRKVTDQERKEAEKRGKFCKVAKPDYSKIAEVKQEVEEVKPKKKKDDISRKKEGDHYSYFGYTKHVYTGKHSEGNRFIRNHDL